MTATLAKIQGNQVKAHASCSSVGVATKEVESLSHSQDIPEGFCQCGCGTPVERIKRTNSARNHVRGEFKRFLHGHNKRASNSWVAEDRGYETPCWIGTTAPTASGYIRVFRDGRMVYLHRWNYEKEHGSVPEGLDLDHLCRVRNCVNPDHVEPVDRAENTRRGDTTKLTATQVAEIKTRPKAPLRDLGAEYGVSISTISSIRKGQSWRDIEPAKDGVSHGA